MSAPLKATPYRLSIVGHTAASKAPERPGYGPWDLSADRANAVRRILEEQGLPSAQIMQVGFLAAILRIATPLIFATLGEMLSERAGVLNLGIEGIMLISAMTGLGQSHRRMVAAMSRASRARHWSGPSITSSTSSLRS